MAEIDRCEHCGMESRALGSHRARCLSVPSVWEATRKALDDGRGVIVTNARYRAMQGQGQQPVSDTTLRKRFGTWAKVADAFGLRWHGVCRRKDAIDQPITAEDREWSQPEPEATYPLHGYRARRVEALYRLPTPGVGLRVVSEYISLR
jgi:hypothetical protein